MTIFEPNKELSVTDMILKLYPNNEIINQL